MGKMIPTIFQTPDPSQTEILATGLPRCHKTTGSVLFSLRPMQVIDDGVVNGKNWYFAPDFHTTGQEVQKNKYNTISTVDIR